MKTTSSANLFFAAALSVLLSACGGAGGGDGGGSSDVALSWEQARVYRANSSTPVTIVDLKTAGPGPVAIYLHGCTGLGQPAQGSDTSAWGELLASLGYTVIMPNSLARPSRNNQLTCDPADPTLRKNQDQYDKRIEEADYALGQVMAASWWDKRQLAMVGYSEGAYTVYRKRYAGPTRFVVAGYWCSSEFGGAPEQRFLFLNGSADPWFYRGGAPFDGKACGLAGGANATNVVVDGAIHNGISTAGGRAAATEFLRISN